MKINLRRGAIEDAAACGQIEFEAFKSISSEHNFPWDSSLETATGIVTMMLSNPGFYSVVAEMDGKVVGSNFLDERNPVAGIGPITVDPAVQNQTVGRQLMLAVMERAAERKFAGVRLVQTAYHNRSLCLYTKLGFDTREPLSKINGTPIGKRIPGYDVRPATQADLLGYLRAWGFPVSPLATRAETIEEAQAYADQRAATRFDLGYDIDGAVIKIDDRWQQQELGSVGRDPRWAIAYKFAPAEGNTKLLGINVSVGRTGALTPIASLAPLKLGGVTITSAQLFNEDEVRRKDLRIGDTVVVQRHGDVIPGIVKAMVELRDGTEQPWTFPTHCPVCNTPVVRAEGGAVTYCPNLQCPARHLENVIHFAAVMDIRGLGEAIAERLVGSAMIHDVADLYHLTKKQLLTLPGFQEKSAENLLRSIETSKAQPFERILCAIGIRMVGEKAAESLAQGFRSVDALLNATEAEISALPGVGPKIAHSVYEWLQVDTHRQFIEKLKAAGLRLEVTDDGSAATDGLPFSGQTFLLTGSLSQLTRGQAEQAIKSLGGKIAPSVTKSLDHLVVGDAPGSKVAKAEKLGVPTRTEEWLVEQLREHGAMPERRERLT